MKDEKLISKHMNINKKYFYLYNEDFERLSYRYAKEINLNYRNYNVLYQGDIYYAQIQNNEIVKFIKL